MSETKHTPGPWTIGDSNNSGVDVELGNSNTSAGIYRFDRYNGQEAYSRDECMANAHLIAAAPDMLAALEDAREALNKPPFINSQTLKCIDAAIAKAKGGAK